MLIKCHSCSIDFECSTRKLNWNKKNNFNLYCSYKCYLVEKKKRSVVNTNCSNCGKDIVKTKAALKKSKTGNLYCSKKCATSNNNKIFKKWKNHPQYKNGKSAYRKKALSTVIKPKCKYCNYDNVNALEVHHIDKNRKNNELTNLEIVCCNCHTLIHKNCLENVV